MWKTPQAPEIALFLYVEEKQGMVAAANRHADAPSSMIHRRAEGSIAKMLANLRVTEPGVMFV